MNEIHRELKQLSEVCLLDNESERQVAHTRRSQEMKAFNEILMYTSGASLEHLHGVE